MRRCLLHSPEPLVKQLSIEIPVRQGYRISKEVMMAQSRIQCQGGLTSIVQTRPLYVDHNLSVQYSDQ